MAEPLPDQTSIRKLSERISVYSKEINSKDSVFVSVAEALYGFYRSANSTDINRKLETLLPYLKLVHQDWGLNAVEVEIMRLASAGVNLGSLAINSQAIARRENRFDVGTGWNEQLLAYSEDNPSVRLALAGAYASVGAWEKLDSLATETLNKRWFTDWTLSRWSSLLVNNLRVVSARRFLSEIADDNPQKELLDLRLSSFESGESKCEFDTRIINLDSEPRKLQLTKYLTARGGYSGERLNAVDGRNLPTFALYALGETKEVYERNGAGAIATALSHMKAWEQLLESSDEHCLVLEDDSVPFTHWEYHRGTVESVLPTTEILWVNQRLSRVIGADEIPVQAVTDPTTVLLNRPRNISGTGTDGYIVSRKGAEKLLDAFSKDCICGHVDGQMMAYSVERNFEAQSENRTYNIVKQLSNRLRGSSLAAQCLSVPMIFANDHGVSNTVSVTQQQRHQPRNF